MDFKKLIQARRSVRKYSEPATDWEIRDILKAAQQAPSWKNMQASRCYVVESEEMLEPFRERVLPGFNQKSSAKAALIVTTFVRDQVGFDNGEPVNEVGNGWGAYDLGLHDAYLVLAAANAGYDTLIMGIRDADAIRDMLHVPDNEQIMSVIAVGKRDQVPAQRPRLEPDAVHKYF